MPDRAGSLDLILNTVPTSHDASGFVALLQAIQTFKEPLGMDIEECVPRRKTVSQVIDERVNRELMNPMLKLVSGKVAVGALLGAYLVLPWQRILAN